MNNFFRSRAFGLCAAYAVMHVLAHVSARWFQITPGISLWYVPGGLALALMVLLGVRYAPVVFFVNLTTSWFPTPPALWMPWFYPLLITAVYGAAAWFVRRNMAGSLLPGGHRRTLHFCLVVVGAPLVMAIAGTAVYYYAMADSPNALSTLNFWHSVINWWIGDASGILTVVPAIMVFVAPWIGGGVPAVTWRGMRAREVALIVIRAGSLLATIILVLTVPGLSEHDAFYLCFLPLIWICAYHGLPGATLAALLVMMVGLVSMRRMGSTVEFSHVFLLFELAVSSVGLGLGTLVSRRNEAERKLAASRAHLDRVISGAQLGVWEYDMATDQLDSNDRLASMIGYTTAEISPLNQWWPKLIHPVDNVRAEEALKAHLDGFTALYQADFRLRTKDGNWRWIDSRGSVMLRDGGGRPLQVSGTHLDITDRKRAEAEVGRLLQIIEATPDFIVTTDADGRVIYANAALLAVCGHAVAALKTGLRLRELISGEAGLRLTQEALPAALSAGIFHGEETIMDTTGRAIITSQVVLAHRDDEHDTFTFSVIMRDISDQKRAESERLQHDRKLLQLQKAESLSVLAGGIAHDFNNLLTLVVGNANLARFELPPRSPVEAYITRIEQAAARAAALCQQMLSYAGRNPVAFAEIDLSRLVEEACHLLEPGIGKKIPIQLELEKSLVPILAARIQMQQVVMNLVLNAIEAIGENEGRVSVRTRSQYLDERAVCEQFADKRAIMPGSYVILEVEDTGCGMSPEIQARIFEPFFTTKFTGQGLGLAAVGGVIKAHRGAIAVKSSPGAGAVFRIALPSLAAKPVPVAMNPVMAGDEWKGSGMILVVDDEDFIGEVAAQILNSFGFSTMIAKDGMEGVEKFRRHSGELVSVLLDLTMPNMDGFEAHAEMHRINPRVPVILMSGFSQKLENLPPEAIHPAGVLAKPFGISQLRERLITVLAAS